MPEILANSPETRSPEGTILDQSQPQPTTTETKSDASPNPPAESKSAPAEYKPFTAPEGAELDPKAVEGATAIFRELGLDQSQAQKLIDFQLNRDKELSTKGADTYNQMRAEWRTQTEADPMIAGHEGGVEGAIAEIGKAIATLPPKLQQELRNDLTLTGAGDKASVVKAFLIFAKSVNEGQHVAGHGPSEEGQKAPGATARPSPAAAMFPNLPSASTH